MRHAYSALHCILRQCRYFDFYFVALRVTVSRPKSTMAPDFHCSPSNRLSWFKLSLPIAITDDNIWANGPCLTNWPEKCKFFHLKRIAMTHIFFIVKNGNENRTFKIKVLNSVFFSVLFYRHNSFKNVSYVNINIIKTIFILDKESISFKLPLFG